MAITATSYIPPGQYESNKVKKFFEYRFIFPNYKVGIKSLKKYL